MRNESLAHRVRAHRTVPTNGLLYAPLRTRRASWIAWLAGLALVAGVVAAAFRLSEGQEFLRLAQRAEPAWLLVAVALQAATYLAQSEIWRRIGRAADFSIRVLTAFQLSLAKLFVDQALPSGGISGTILMARSLEDLGMPRSAVMASIAINTAAYYAVYVVSLAAVLLAVSRDQANALVLLLAIVFFVFAIIVTASVIVLSGREPGAITRRFAKFGPIRVALQFLAQADPRLARNPRLLAEASACQLAIVALDATTMWVLLRALGVTASPSGVFASFMLSSLLRTMGVVPGGLGTFEAASVVTLKLAGVDLATALATTLMFRGLSFWLPMLPGLWFSRRALRSPSPTRSSTCRRPKAC